MSGHPSTHRGSPFVYAVFVDGTPFARHHGDPFAAIHAAETAKAEHPDFPVVIVVLDAEEAGYSADELACRPFMVPPAEQAEFATKQSRQPALLGATDGSDKEGV